MYRRWGWTIQAALERLACTAWFSYITLFLLQLKVVWGAWLYRDLTTGDTAGYYRIAYGWYRQFTDNAAWSPIYTSFYGSFLRILDDAYFATIMHRLVIVFL